MKKETVNTKICYECGRKIDFKSALLSHKFVSMLEKKGKNINLGKLLSINEFSLIDRKKIEQLITREDRENMRKLWDSKYVELLCCFCFINYRNR